MKNTLCFDIGGTAIKCAVLSEGKVLWQNETPTLAHEGADSLMQCILQMAQDVKRLYDYSKVGVCSAGQINPVMGTVLHATDNLRGWTGTQIKDLIEKSLNMPVAVENDVKAAAIGEWKYGAARGEDSFVMATFGTGIGGAIFHEGSILRGSGFAAGEWGHIVTHADGVGLKCTCGGTGCWETVASAKALLDAIHSKAGLNITGYELPDLVKTNSEVRQIYNNWKHEIEVGLRSITYVLNPPLIVLGGGIMMCQGLVEEIDLLLHGNLMPNHQMVSVKPAQMGNLAGIYGVYYLSGLL